MIQTLAPDRANQSLNVGALPWCAVREDDFLDAHVLDALSEIVAIDPITISNQEAWGLVVRERLDNLLGRPSRGRVGRDVEMNDATPVMPQDDETVQQAKTHRCHDEEIDRGDVGYVILEEHSPGL
ncbi:MAG: hypothetical protein ACYSVY_08640 [Planctomycetota bacterium]